MADPSARAKEAAIPLPEAPADVEISSVGEDTDDDMACAAQKDRSSTEEPSSEVNGLGTRLTFFVAAIYQCRTVATGGGKSDLGLWF
ncbi:hypothetical protein AK812_SmicGene118 [Symbiodinium microadriaticum]|uniref:Uncharacterized protein n=1 Tax=Symbiodinium microadriaticum TaxID=2951 RepID=A0A1Q9F7H5_SYMMI|nr:hypothetical protein AK812_SmicGene118 [Symbiodinium microadriaticum]